MKPVLIPLVAATLLVAGCGEDSKATKAVNTVSNAVGAPVDYLNAAVQAQKHAEKVIDVSYLNQAIQLFQASEGRLPKDLNELVPNYVGKLPPTPFGTKLVYDAKAGTVKVVKE